VSTRLHYVYFLYQGETLKYVGRSVNPKSRRRVFERRTGVSVTMAMESYPTIEEAQKAELLAIRTLSPEYNKVEASSPTRLGLANSKSHNKAISSALKGKNLTKEHRDKLWAERDRSKEANAFFGKKHTVESIEKIKAANKAQFSDEEKRERHRAACIRSMQKRKEAGEKIGRPKRNLTGERND